MKNSYNLINKKFGLLKIIELDTNYDKRRGRKWKCLCECGKFISYYASILKNGEALTCGESYHKIKDLTNQKFGSWTVLSKIGKQNNGTNTYWLCKCICGKISNVRGTALLKGKSNSCKCKSIERSRICNSLPKGQSAFNIVYKRYKREALNRRLEWSITIFNFKKITRENCFYCGDFPKNKSKTISGEFIYNGLDRINNNIGYILSNIVPCCGDCNRAKYHKTKEEFLKHIEKIYNYQKTLLKEFK